MAMFEDALMESGNTIKTKSKYWSFLAMCINSAVLTALILWPLVHPDALPRKIIAGLLVAPSPPMPSTPQASTPGPQVRSKLLEDEVQAPSKIPKEVKLDKGVTSFQSSLIDVIGTNGVLDGTRGGSLNDLFSGVGTRPIIARETLPKKLRISSGVMAGNLLDQQTVPQYPAIAKAAGIQGTVTLQATIAKTGTIENLRAISGPPMLQKSAMDAVRSWRYKPYLLNGEAVEVETTINVVFNLVN